jgi:hypothetical protein
VALTNRTRFVPECFLAIALIAQATVILSARYFPYVDITNHLSRYVLIGRCLWESLPPGVEVAFRLSPFIGLDALGVVLARVLPVETAGKVLALLAALAPGLGLYLFLRAACPSRRGWALLGLLLAFSRYYLISLFNYLVAMGALFAWLGGYWQVRKEPNGWAIFGLAVAGLALDMIHLSAVLILGLVVGADLLWNLWQALRSSGPETGFVRPTRQLFLAVATLGPAVTLWVVMVLLQPKHLPGDVPSFRPPLAKLLGVSYPFYTLSWSQMGVMTVGYLAGVGVLAWGKRHTLYFDSVALAIVLLLGCYVAFPVAANGTHDLDVRFLLPALLLVPAIGAARDQQPRPATGPQRAGSAAWALLVPLVACLLVDGIVFRAARQIDEDLSDYAQVIAQIPAGANLLPLVCEPAQLGVPVYQHFAHWHSIRGRGRVPGLFASPETSFYEHCRVTFPPLYNVDLHWGTQQVTPLDARRIADDYQAIILIGDNPDALAEVQQHATLYRRVGRVMLFLLPGTIPDVSTQP